MASQTGLEVVIVGIGLVKSGAPGSNMSQLHRSGTFIVPAEDVVDGHRLVMIRHSTGGPVWDVMETPCATVGFKDSSTDPGVKQVRSAMQALWVLSHKVRDTLCCDKWPLAVGPVHSAR